MLAILVVSVFPARADVTYTLGADPVITNSSDIEEDFQSITGAALTATVDDTDVTDSLIAVGVVNQNTDNNELYSRLTGDSSTLSYDIGLVSGSAADVSLSVVGAQEIGTSTGRSRIATASVTSTVTDPFSSSSVSVTGNTIEAETTLAESSATAQGQINLGLDNSRDGDTTLDHGAVPVDGDAGLYVVSAQTNSSVTPDAGLTFPFAEADTTNIGMTIDGVFGDTLYLEADSNTISASFNGNDSDNLLDVQAGAATSLETSAGIANMQVNDTVNAGNLPSARVEESNITVSIQDDPLTTSTLSFQDNRIATTGRGNIVVNELQVADTLNVDIGDAPRNRLDYTAGSENAITEGGLFINNMQINTDGTAISATATDPAGVPSALSVDSRGLIDSVLTADGNSFNAIAIGNDALSSIEVLGATNFSSAVAASNLQSADTTPVTATATSGTLAVNLGGSPALVDAPENDIINSSVSVSGNTVSAYAVNNRDPLIVDINGNSVTDGSTRVSNTRSANSLEDLASTNGFSAINSQSATGSAVTATNTDGGIEVAVGGHPVGGAPGPRTSDSEFTLSQNTISSLAYVNYGVLVSLSIDANVLDASSAVASVQNAATSSVTSTTSGDITIGVNTRTSGYATAPSNLAILVGDEDPTDDTFTGNAISSSASGNVNNASLSADAATTMLVNATIDSDGASIDVFDLSSTDAATNRLRGEMSVLTDQRWDSNDVTATTGFSRIVGSLRISSDPVSNSTLNVDGNQVTSTGRGNKTDNTLDFTALSIDMSGAESGAPNTAAGTNLASMGAVQDIADGTNITAEIQAGPDAPGATDSEIMAFQRGSGDITNLDISASYNTVEVNASGNTSGDNSTDTVTGSLSGSGGTLAQDAPGTLAGTLNSDPSTTDLDGNDIAVGNAVIQENAGTVTATLADDQNYQITARTQGFNDPTDYGKDVTTSTIAANNNSASAFATGNSAVAETTLDFSTLESSGATAIQQIQSGATTATVGLTDGGVTISAYTTDNTQLHDSTVQASNNSAGAQTVGAMADAGFKIGDDGGTLTIASGYADGAAGPSLTIDPADLDTDISADFMVNSQQVVSGTSTATANNMSVLAAGGTFDGSNLLADTNLLSALATGGDSTGTLSFEANSMTAGGTSANTVNGILASEQSLSGGVTAALTNSDVAATAIDLTYSTFGTNAADAISVDNNTLQAAGTGLDSDNTLATTAGTSMAGDLVEPALVGTTATGFDRLIVSVQGVNAGIDVDSTTTNVTIDVTGEGTPDLPGDVQDDDLTVNGNMLTARGTGADSGNTLTATAGTSIDTLSQGILAAQVLDATVDVDNTDANAEIDIAGISTNSDLSVSSNRFGATGTGLRGANTFTLSASTSILDDVDTIVTNDIASYQDVNAAVTADLTNSNIDLRIQNPDNLGDSVSGGNLEINGNFQYATAQGGTNTNTMSATSGAIGDLTPEGVGFLIYAEQDGGAAVTATNTNSDTSLSIDDGDVTGATLSVSQNSVSATADNLIGTNTLTAASSTVNMGDRSVLDFDSAGQPEVTGPRADRRILSDQMVDGAGDVTATVSSANMEIDLEDGEDGNLEGSSTATMDGNQILATARVATGTNTLNNTANTTMNSSSLIGLDQDSSADATASVTDSGLDVFIDQIVEDAAISLSGNYGEAAATSLSATNTLNASGGTIDTDAPIDGSVDHSPGDRDMLGFSGIIENQIMAGSISATVSDFYVFADADDDDILNSNINVSTNRLRSFSTLATATNSLTQDADNAMMQAPALLVAGQDLDSGVLTQSTAATTGSRIEVQAGDEVTDSNILVGGNNLVGGNIISAQADGGVLDNDLTVSAGQMTGTDSLGEIDSLNTGVPDHVMQGSTLLSSQQTLNAQISASATDADNTIYVSVDEDVDNSRINVDQNVIQALSTMANANNNLTQQSDTSISDAPAMLAASQTLAGTSTVDVSGIIETEIDDTSDFVTSDSNLTVDNNTFLGQNTGGTMVNTLSAEAGTTISMAALGAPGAPSVAAATDSNFDGSFGLSSRQGSTVDVTGTVRGEVDLNITGDITDSTLSVSGNTIRNQAINLDADNTVDVMASTSQTNVRTGVLSYQDVAGSTGSTIDGAPIWAFGEDLTGTSTLESNSTIAVATGGDVDNELSVSRLNSTGGTVGASDELDTSSALASLSAAGGTATQNSLLNVQQRTDSVTSTINTTDDAVEVRAEYDDVTGTVRVGAEMVGGTLVGGNLIGGQARGLDANNDLNLASSTEIDGGSAALGSAQYGDALVNSTLDDTGGANLGFYLNALDVAGTATLDGNTGLASATSNLAINSLTADAGTRIIDLGTETATGVSGASGTDISADTVGLALQNTQNGTANATSTALISDLEIDSNLTTLVGVASVDYNRVDVDARGQEAQNSMALNAATGLNASASLTNAQFQGGNIDSGIDNGFITLNTLDDPGFVNDVDGTVSVSNNSVTSTGIANLALNNMDISGSLAASTGGSTNTIGGLNPDATADYVALNSQRTTANVDSSVLNYDISYTSAGTTNGVANVDNNLILADSTGNNSTNTFTITPRGTTNTADFAFTGYQSLDGGTISSSISNATVGLSAAGATGVFSTSGNSIGATTTGNVSVSTTSIGN